MLNSTRLLSGLLSFDELLPLAKRHSARHEATYGMVGGMALLALSLVLLR